MNRNYASFIKTLLHLIKKTWIKSIIVIFLFSLFLANNGYFGVELFFSMIYGWILGLIIGKGLNRFEINAAPRNELISSAVLYIISIYIVFCLYASFQNLSIVFTPFSLIENLKIISTNGFQVLPGVILKSSIDFKGTGFYIMWISEIIGSSLSFFIAVNVFK